MQAKRLIVRVMVVALVAGGLFAGCTGGATPTPAPAPSPEPEGKWPQPNPMWGTAIKPDGTPFEFWNVDIGPCNGWMVTAEGMFTSLVERAGGTAKWVGDLEPTVELGSLEDIAIRGRADAVVLMPMSSAVTNPGVEKCEEAGIPVYNYNWIVPTDKLTFLVHYDERTMGDVSAQYIVDWAEQNNEDIYCYVIWGMMEATGSQERWEGIVRTLESSPNFKEIIESPDCGYVPSNATEPVRDALGANPQINSIIGMGCYANGTIEGLRVLDKLYPLGDPRHIVYTQADGGPGDLEAWEDGYLDGVGTHGPWELVDMSVKAMINEVCLGLDMPDESMMDLSKCQPAPDRDGIILTSQWITYETMNNPEYTFGAPRMWFNMFIDPEYGEDFDKWPILDTDDYGIPTPSLDLVK